MQFPAGGGFLWFTGTAPDGYLLCQGQEVDRTIYSRLYALLGTVYGAGTTTTFTLPDLRQRIPIGKAATGIAGTLGATFGTLSHTHTYDDVVAHTHNVYSNHGGAGGSQVSIGDTDSGSQAVFAAKDVTSLQACVDSTGSASGVTSAVDPPCFTVNFAIKY